MEHEHREEHHTRPTTDHPLHGEHRPVMKPLLAVVGLVTVVVVVFVVLTWLRYST